MTPWSSYWWCLHRESRVLIMHKRRLHLFKKLNGCFYSRGEWSEAKIRQADLESCLVLLFSVFVPVLFLQSKAETTQLNCYPWWNIKLTQRVWEYLSLSLWSCFQSHALIEWAMKGWWFWLNPVQSLAVFTPNLTLWPPLLFSLTRWWHSCNSCRRQTCAAPQVEPGWSLWSQPSASCCGWQSRVSATWHQCTTQRTIQLDVAHDSYSGNYVRPPPRCTMPASPCWL